MRRSNEPRIRIYGPRKHGNLWRLQVVTSFGGGRRQTSYLVYPTRAQAESALKGAQDENDGVTVRQAVNALLDKMRAEGLAEVSITTNEYRLVHFFNLPANDD